jgi:hypothetical protein
VFENKIVRKIFGAKDGRCNSGVEKTTLRGASRSVLHTIYYSGHHIKKNEMGGACSRREREERCIVGFGGETGWKETTWNT